MRRRAWLLGLAVVGCSSSPGGQPQPTPSPTVQPCASLPARGTFEDITPPEVKAGFGVVQDGGGTFTFVVDPVNQGTVYLGTLRQKVWKSTDCGATWTAVATGRNGDRVNSGMNWTFVIDPTDPDVLYTNAGYGNGTNGLYKSVNAGVDWDPVWPPPTQPDLAKAFTYQFANVLAMDPSDHQHLLLTFHEPCLPPHPDTCIAESHDAGATWRLIDGDPSWDGGEGQVIYFLDNDHTWLWASQQNGFFRSSNAGASWTNIPGMNESHLQGSQLYRTRTGSFFVAASEGIWRSSDGTVASWRQVPNTGPIVGGMLGDGSTLYAVTCYFPGFCAPRYLTSAESDGETWTALSAPTLSMGGSLGLDPGHGLLYSSNGAAGFWRITLR